MSKSIVGSLAIALVSAAAGCASPSTHVVSPNLAVAIEAPPATEDAVSTASTDALMLGEQVKHHVEITIDKLPPPCSVDAKAKTYVFWVRKSETEAWSNAAHLNAATVAQEAHFPYSDDVLFVNVTAEPAETANHPSSNVLLSTRVMKDGACASMVDAKNLQMKVRMCSDER